MGSMYVLKPAGFGTRNTVAHHSAPGSKSSCTRTTTHYAENPKKGAACQSIIEQFSCALGLVQGQEFFEYNLLPPIHMTKQVHAGGQPKQAERAHQVVDAELLELQHDRAQVGAQDLGVGLLLQV